MDAAAVEQTAIDPLTPFGYQVAHYSVEVVAGRHLVGWRVR